MKTLPETAQTILHIKARIFDLLARQGQIQKEHGELEQIKKKWLEELDEATKAQKRLKDASGTGPWCPDCNKYHGAEVCPVTEIEGMAAEGEKHD